MENFPTDKGCKVWIAWYHSRWQSGTVFVAPTTLSASLSTDTRIWLATYLLFDFSKVFLVNSTTCSLYCRYSRLILYNAQAYSCCFWNDKNISSEGMAEYTHPLPPFPQWNHLFLVKIFFSRKGHPLGCVLRHIDDRYDDRNDDDVNDVLNLIYARIRDATKRAVIEKDRLSELSLSWQGSAHLHPDEFLVFFIF
jgi:hypothetical protein